MKPASPTSVAAFLIVVLLVIADSWREHVGRVAMMSSPLPFAWDVQPKLLLIAELPYAFIAPVCVAGALVGHIVLRRRLMLRSEKTS